MTASRRKSASPEAAPTHAKKTLKVRKDTLKDLAADSKQAKALKGGGTGSSRYGGTTY